MDEADFQRLGIHDPTAPDAPERLRLLRYLASLGATEDELVEAFRTFSGGDLALDLHLRGGQPMKPFDEIVTEQGLDPDEAAEYWKALGFPDPRLHATRIPASAGEALAVVAATGQLFLGNEAALGLTRVIGSATFRMAQALIDSFRMRYEIPQLQGGTSYAQVVEGYGQLTREMLPLFWNAVEAVFQRHLVAVAAGRWAPDMENEAPTRELVVGFVDLSGFTEYTRVVGRVADLITRFERLVAEVVSGPGTRVVKHIGDGAMFTVDDPAEACAVALALLERSAEGGDLPPMRAALASGPVVAIRGDYFGNVVNLAARLMGAAAPSTVLTDEDVATRAGARFVFEPLGPATLKGYSDPPAVFRLVGRSS